MCDCKKIVSDLRNVNINYEVNKLTNEAADAIEELCAAVIDREERIGRLQDLVLYRESTQEAEE